RRDTDEHEALIKPGPFRREKGQPEAGPPGRRAHPAEIGRPEAGLGGASPAPPPSPPLLVTERPHPARPGIWSPVGMDQRLAGMFSIMSQGFLQGDYAVLREAVRQCRSWLALYLEPNGISAQDGLDGLASVLLTSWLEGAF